MITLSSRKAVSLVTLTNSISAHQLALLPRSPISWLRAFASHLLGLGASGLVPWSPPLLPTVPLRRSFGMPGGACGWVACRAGLWGVLRGFGLPVPAPRLLGTHPPIGTKALNWVQYNLTKLTTWSKLALWLAWRGVSVSVYLAYCLVC